MPRYSIAIVGAGPAGYFAAQALQNLQNDELQFSIDLIERLPTPWGLVRSGVAPDHPKIKSVSKVFEKVATAGNVSLFGNVEVGKDISFDTLTEKYDAVVIATGTSIGKKLGIPGEGLKNSLSSAEFVPWYNGHPDFADLNPDLNCDTAVVIGAGNVAMDCARLLAVDSSELEPTDTAAHALEAFKKSKIRHVYICARRGAENVAFTSPELRELPDLEHTNVVISKKDIEGAISRAGHPIERGHAPVAIVIGPYHDGAATATQPRGLSEHISLHRRAAVGLHFGRPNGNWTARRHVKNLWPRRALLLGRRFA